MTANVLIDDSTMTAIGDAIRNKTGKDELMLPADMPGEIEGIEAGGDKWKKIVQGIIDRSITEIDLSDFELASIGHYAFQNCTSLTSIILPKGLTSIGSFSFAGCTNLALTSLPEGLTTLDDSAFRGCVGLESITFKGKPDSIRENAFNGCTNLTTINVPWSEGEVVNAPWGATNATINYNYTESEEI